MTRRTRTAFVSFVSFVLALAATATVGAGAASATPLGVGRGDAVVHVRTVAEKAGVVLELSDPWSSRYGTAASAVSATRTGVGRFSVRFKGVWHQGGNAQLVMYQDEDGSSSFCTIAKWARSGSTQRVDVRCFDEGGGATDAAEFDVMYTNADRAWPAWPIGGYDYLWSDRATFAGSRIPSATYRFGGSGVPTVAHVGAGRYVVAFPGQYEDPHPYVTAYGTLPRSCNVVTQWFAKIAGMYVSVACFDAAGVHADSRFSFTMSEGDPLGTTLGAGAMLWAPVPAGTGWVTPLSHNHNYASADANRYHSWAIGGGEIVVHVPDVATGGRRTVWAQALGDTGERCKIVSVGEDAIDWLLGDDLDAYVDVQCIAPDGTSTDTPVLAYRWDRP